MKKTFTNILLALLLSLFFVGCGESMVEVGENTYEPKIVIEGFLSPGKKVEGIIITRNIPLNTSPNPATLVLNNAEVRLIDLQTNKEFKLNFNLQKLSFEYGGNDLSIGYDKSYKLIVNATIDGKYLTASSITKVPKEGFKIIDSQTISGTIRYRERDEKENVKEIPLTFNLSEGTSYYPISIVALDASDTTFIYDNAYREVKREDVKKNLDTYKYQRRWLQNVNSFAKSIYYDINWTSIWFYSKYRIIVYAGDENFRLFSQTHRNVQEFDGNFHEPRLNIQGNGIGVFGSVIPDTVYFYVTK